MISGKVEIDVRGLNLEKFLNDIKNKYCIYKVDRKEYNQFSIIIKSTHLKPFCQELKNYGYKYEIKKTYGVYKAFSFCLERFSLTVCSIAMLCVYMFSNIFLWAININGNINIKNSEIVSVLRDNGISIGKSKGTLDADNIEKLLLKNFNDIGLVSVQIYGNSLNINISEKLAREELDYEPIVSQYNGIVRELTLISGTTNVKVGQSVKKGQTLIEPFIIDSAGNKKSIKAKANILLEVDFNYKIEYNKNREIYEDTGNTFVSINYSLWGLKFRKDKSSPYTNYRKEETQYFTNSLLPIKKIKTKYYEQKPKAVIIPFEECKQQVIDEAYDGVYKLAGGNDLTSISHDIVNVGEMVYVIAKAKSMIKLGG